MPYVQGGELVFLLSYQEIDEWRAGTRMEGAARLQLMPHRPASEHIDGTWWPRSRRLVDELPALVASVSDRLGQVVMVGYRRNGWDDAPPLAEMVGHTIELLGFDSDEPASVIAIGNQGRHITLQVIPPDASEQVARAKLDETQRRAGTCGPATGASTIARSVADVADKLARHEGRGDEQRTGQIRQWCEHAAQQFVDAPVQNFIPILVEHIVRNRMIETRAPTVSVPASIRD